MDPQLILGGINTAAQVAGTVGGFMGGGKEGLSRTDQRYVAHKNIQWGDDALYRGVQIRANDAREAGLHPLAALGMMPTNSSMAPGTGSEGPNLGDRLNAMGQNVSRAISATQTAEQRAMFNAQLEEQKANAITAKANAIEAMRRVLSGPSNPPPMPNNSSIDPYSYSGDVQGIKNKHVLIRQPDGTVRLEESPDYGSTLYHRPVSSVGRDLLTIVKDALSSGTNLYHNLYWRNRKNRGWKSEL